MVRVYTKKGDEGFTDLASGQRVPKDHMRISAYGTIDELNAVMGLIQSELAIANTHPQIDAISEKIARIQNQLFNLGSELALAGKSNSNINWLIDASQIKLLEDEIDAATEVLPPLKNFILPGGSKCAAYIHLARTVCRRAERNLVSLSHPSISDENPPRLLLQQYLNRLSDWLFTFARYTNKLLGQEETKWQPQP